ncbi:hypothetical protein CTAYLR_003326 [Chrysophaeum taylorii]|uniref:Histidinol-phosphatase n=1 Tax=Chrysophaeum taylorii TaxID=2483200 RepID=A0AAD7XN67_9STRA|nr:hypothetical protein CTAYLR_003326 [Chrysophaeum taylorii]
MKPEPEVVEFAQRLADAAGDVIRQYWRQPLVIKEKFDASRVMPSEPVTEADRGAERAMRDLISATYPAHGILGEEFGETNPLAEWVWVLDPIDGTKSFTSGKPLFGTLVALCYRGVPVLGVIDQCVLGERWVGDGETTTFNGKLVSAEGKDRIENCLAYATTPSMFAPGYETAAFEALRRRTKRTLYGCDCYAYALLASNFGVDLVVEADLQPYDYLSLVPVLSGAGALITDWRGNPLTLHSASSKGRVLAAANPTIHKAAIDLLRRPPLDLYLLNRPKLAISLGAAVAMLGALLLGNSRRLF